MHYYELLAEFVQPEQNAKETAAPVVGVPGERTRRPRDLWEN
jgi:hypothetical protein